MSGYNATWIWGLKILLGVLTNKFQLIGADLIRPVTWSSITIRLVRKPHTDTNTNVRRCQASGSLRYPPSVWIPALVKHTRPNAENICNDKQRQNLLFKLATILRVEISTLQFRNGVEPIKHVYKNLREIQNEYNLISIFNFYWRQTVALTFKVSQKLQGKVLNIDSAIHGFTAM